MTKKIVAGCLAVAILGGLAGYSGYLYTTGRQDQQTDSGQPEPLPTEERPSEEVSSDPASVQAETKNYSYFLVEEFGYVNIYLSDKESIYEYTEIPVNSLPEELQQEICIGKGIETEQELYDFLENYSS